MRMGICRQVMKLRNETALSQRKLTELLKLIEKKQELPAATPAHKLSLDSMRRMAERLRSEIEEYEKARQPS